MRPEPRTLAVRAPWDYAPAIGRILLTLAAVAVLAVSAGDGFAARAAARDDRTKAASDAVVDLRSAIAQERYAIHAVDTGNRAGAIEAVVHSQDALAAVSAMADRMLADDLPGLPDTGWAKVKRDTALADSHYDLDALLHLRHHLSDEDTIHWIRSAITAKGKALSVAKYLAGPPCSELVNVRGPIMVNNVPQGPWVLTLSFSCSVAVDVVDVDIPGADIQSCDGDGQPCTVNGDLVKLKAGGDKTPTMTLDTENIGGGEHFVEDVVPIAGDTIVVDETM